MGNICRKRRNGTLQGDVPLPGSKTSSTIQSERNPAEGQSHTSSTQGNVTMEKASSDQGRGLKKNPTGKDPSVYGQFRVTLGTLLTLRHCLTLAIWFGYPAGIIDSIRNSNTPSLVFVEFMDDRGEISPTDISKLIDALEHESVGLQGVAAKVKEAFGLQTEKSQPFSVTIEKKTQFVKELKNKYRNLCGEIQPAPFLRDKYNIDKLFVQGGIKFLDEKQGESIEQEKWKILKDYKTVFTDPQIKSTRRIIDGGPGYGKSTLALQITYDWCQGVAPMNDFEILISLRLRQFRNVPTIYSAIRNFLLPRDSKLTDNDIKSIVESSATVILLDGYDEYPDRENRDSVVNHIVSGEMFQEYEVILTTRTSCLPTKCTHDTRRIRLTGFDDATRETYIRNVVARGCSDVADQIITFLKVNPVPADLCKIPLFFAMICYMVKNSEKFRNLETVTLFFRHIIKCFHGHRDIKFTEENQGIEIEHSKLDEIAFKGLSGDAQQISWSKRKLINDIGKSLYDEYVHIGILMEEEGFDYDSLEYYTETRFFHKLFAEWYAAHYLAKEAAKFESRLEINVEEKLKSLSTSAGTSQPHQATNRSEADLLKSLDPDDLHYMFRYASGLNPDSALRIIEHLRAKEFHAQYTLLCITEWGGSLGEIEDTVALLCSRPLTTNGTDSLLLQKSTLALLEFASKQKIPIKELWLNNCLHVGSSGTLLIMPVNLPLTVLNTLVELEICEVGRVLTEEETAGILQYAAMCPGLNELGFMRCLPSQFIEVNESISALRARHVTVMWCPGSTDTYILNLESGVWEDERSGKTMTDEDYLREVEKVRYWEEWRQQRLEQD